MTDKLRMLFHTAADPMLAVARVGLGSIAIVQGFQNIGMLFAGALLLAGVLGRLGAVGVGAGAIAAAIAGDRPEYWLATLALAALVLVRGSGAWSIDRLLMQPLQARADRPRSLPLHNQSIYVSWTWFHVPHFRRW